MNRCKQCHGYADEVYLIDHDGYCPRCSPIPTDFKPEEITESCNNESESPTIRIFLQGGGVQGIEGIPKGITVEINDCDDMKISTFGSGD
jgi:hypothetical protein